MILFGLATVQLLFIILTISMTNLLYIALGGALGSVLRYLISAGTIKQFGDIAIWGTFSVNIIGSFLIGIVWAFIENNHNDSLKSLLMIGILGGFTTFSSYALESLNLLKDNEIKLAAIYIIATNLGGIVLSFIGYFLMKYLSTNNIS